MKLCLSNKDVFIAILLITSIHISIYAQVTYASKLSDASREIYEFPNNAIEIGLEVYNAKDSSIEEKVDALMLISTAYSSKRNYVMSLDYANNALALLDEIKSISFKIKVLNKVGVQYQQLNIYDKAINYLDHALELADRKNNKDSIANLIGYNYGARGFIYREQMSCEIALNYFNKSLYYFKINLEKDPIMNANISIINYNKGNCFNALNMIDSAKISFNKAIEFSKVIDAKSLEGFAKKGLSEVYTSEGNYRDAIKTLIDAYEISSEVGDLILNQGVYKGLSDNYLAINDRENFELYKTKFEKIHAIIKRNERNTINNTITNILKENNDEIKALKSRQNINSIGLIFIVIAFMLFLFIEIRVFILKSKDLLSFNNKLKIKLPSSF
jgi:tetratricopeptide (TPR) repeat protein